MVSLHAAPLFFSFRLRGNTILCPIHKVIEHNGHLLSGGLRFGRKPPGGVAPNHAQALGDGSIAIVFRRDIRRVCKGTGKNAGKGGLFFHKCGTKTILEA